MLLLSRRVVLTSAFSLSSSISFKVVTNASNELRNSRYGSDAVSFMFAQVSQQFPFASSSSLSSHGLTSIPSSRRQVGNDQKAKAFLGTLDTSPQVGNRESNSTHSVSHFVLFIVLTSSAVSLRLHQSSMCESSFPLTCTRSSSSEQLDFLLLAAPTTRTNRRR